MVVESGRVRQSFFVLYGKTSDLLKLPGKSKTYHLKWWFNSDLYNMVQRKQIRYDKQIQDQNG